MAKPSPKRYEHEKKLLWEASGHQWQQEDGDMDIFAFESGGGHHNGPRCTACGYAECWHCVDEPPPCPMAKKKPKAVRRSSTTANKP